jgi:hypothetical protein
MAMDKSIYYGKWHGNAGNSKIMINLKKRKTNITINGTPVSQAIKYEYTYSNVSPYPFLSIKFTDDKQAEHLFYLTIGIEADNKTRLLGFYEVSQIIPNSHGKLESISYSLKMEQ